MISGAAQSGAEQDNGRIVVAEPPPTRKPDEWSAQVALIPDSSRATAHSAMRVLDPSVSVVVSVSSDLSTLERCLRSILRSDYDDFEVIVVERRPQSLDIPRMLVNDFPSDHRLRYVEEPSSSISVARNTGLARAEAMVVAFIDDDVVVDRDWLRSSAEALRSETGIACVTSLSLPGGFDSELQFLLEPTGRRGIWAKDLSTPRAREQDSGPRLRQRGTRRRRQLDDADAGRS